MKKIKILTFHASHNAGSMLQSYALKKYIENKFNAKVEIINFSNLNQQRIYAKFPKPRKFKHIIRNMLYFVYSNLISQHYDSFEAFKKCNLVESTEYISDVSQLNEEEDVNLYICGGDQIWNIDCEDSDDCYFLPFVKSKNKISYSVSLGATNILEKSADKQEKYKQFLNEFLYISVRERNAKKWLETLLEKEVSIMPDPTLLLDRNSWYKLLKKEEVEERKDFIFFYSMAYNPEICEKLKKISQTYNLPVVVFDAKSWVAKGLWKYGFKVDRIGGPIRFLHLINDAKLVITNSLHGTLFSALFHKTFWSIQSDTHSKNDDRAVFLLQQLNLYDRFISTEQMLEVDLFETIDFKDTECAIREMNEVAYEYLNRAIKES